MNISSTTDLDRGPPSAAKTFSTVSTRATARRLHRTRQHLGAYRHDLLIAMRVVNNIEREMMHAEWENWLLDENTRCHQVGMMLREQQSTSSTKGAQRVDGEVVLELGEGDGRGVEDLRRWQEEYCGSCRTDQEDLFMVRKPFAPR